MSSARDLLREAHERGLRVYLLAPGRIRVEPIEGDQVPGDLVERMRSIKDEIERLLEVEGEPECGETDQDVGELLLALQRHGVVLEPTEAGLRVAMGTVPREVIEDVIAHSAELERLLRSALPECAITAEHAQSALRFFSNVVQRDLWVTSDEATADELWSETRLPVLTLDEIIALSGRPIELWRVLLDVNAVFGPGTKF